jgi:hypothetical protein
VAGIENGTDAAVTPDAGGVWENYLTARHLKGVLARRAG